MKSRTSKYIEEEISRMENFKGMDSEYVSISNEYLETFQDGRGSFRVGQDTIDLHKYLAENKYGIRDEDREMLEEMVVTGIPDNLRRRFWLSVSEAFGYLKNYSPGYYATLSSENE
jgi:hypothetical protein